MRSVLFRKTTSIACFSRSSLVLDLSSAWFANRLANPSTTGIKTAAKIFERLSAFSHVSRSAMTHPCALDQRLRRHSHAAYVVAVTAVTESTFPARGLAGVPPAEVGLIKDRLGSTGAESADV